MFNKRKLRLTDNDARKYTEFFIDRTHSSGKSILASLPYTLQAVVEDEPKAWLDTVSAWHQAIAREQLVMLSFVFYGGEQVEDQALHVLDEMERERSRRGFMKQDLDKFMTRVEKTSNALMGADGDTRYFDVLVALTTPLLAEDFQSEQYVERVAEELRVQHIVFWKKHGYCK